MHEMHKLAVDVTFTQMTAKKGIKKRGEIAVAAMYKKIYTKERHRSNGGTET